MTRLFQLICIATVLCGNVLPAAAQTPDTGMLAAGVDIGAFFPDDAFENALTVDGFGELYVTPRFSGRALLAWTSPGVNGRTEDHFRQFKLLFNGVYNWEMGVWHPYVTAGAGAYFVRLLLDDRPDPEGETRGGLNFGGGIEYFATALTTVKGELRWDVVSDPPGLPDATGLTITIGLKRYF
ncbi:MAG TPA: outer membrane beta-barrel protein [Vicinamibacterales bacterium]